MPYHLPQRQVITINFVCILPCLFNYPLCITQTWYFSSFLSLPMSLFHCISLPPYFCHPAFVLRNIWFYAYVINQFKILTGQNQFICSSIDGHLDCLQVFLFLPMTVLNCEVKSAITYMLELL